MQSLGVPTHMFAVMFALGRLPGWIAQWKEMRENHEPIGRPQIYTGYNLRKYIPILNDSKQSKYEIYFIGDCINI